MGNPARAPGGDYSLRFSQIDSRLALILPYLDLLDLLLSIGEQTRDIALDLQASMAEGGTVNLDDWTAIRLGNFLGWWYDLTGRVDTEEGLARAKWAGDRLGFMEPTKAMSITSGASLAGAPTRAGGLPAHYAYAGDYWERLLNLAEGTVTKVWDSLATLARTGTMGLARTSDGRPALYINVQFSAIPAGFGHSVATPYYYYDLGWYSFGSDGGYDESKPFHFANSVLRVPAGADSFRWELVPGPSWQYRIAH
jgi:hypothetical protein